MFTILWFLFIAFAIAAPIVWVLDHNGLVVITWLGYQVSADILTAIILAVFCALVIFVFSYFLTRLLAFKFPNLLKIFFKKSHVKRLEKVVLRHHQAFEIMTNLMLALEVGDKKSAADLQKKFAKLVKNPSLNNFFLGKIAFQEESFDKAAQLFSKFNEHSKPAKILVLKSKFKLALKTQDEFTAIAYAKQILLLKRDSFETAIKLFVLYKKRGLWQDAKALIAEYGSEQFKDELQKRDTAVINTALAFEAYQQKKFLIAIKHANIALKAENNFLPAQEIQLKSWLKLGFNFKVSWKVKSLWRNNPHLIFAEIFDLINRKSNAKSRIKAMKKLAALNSESALGKLAVGIVAFRAGAFQQAKDFLNLSLLQEKTYRAYKLLAFAERSLGNDIEYKKNLIKSEMLSKDDHYLCNSCFHLSSKWSAKCSSCGSYDSLEWSS
jgi:HemY protein